MLVNLRVSNAPPSPYVLIDAAPVLLRIGTQHAGEVRGLRLRRHTQSLGAVPAQARLLVEPRLAHPDRVVLLDRRTDGPTQPFLALLPAHFDALLHRGVAAGRLGVGKQMRVHLKGNVCKEWRLRSHQVVRAVPVQDLVVVLDFKDVVLHHALGEINTVVSEEAEPDKVAVPVVELVKPRARDDERHTLHVDTAGFWVPPLLHRNWQQTGA